MQRASIVPHSTASRRLHTVHNWCILFHLHMHTYHIRLPRRAFGRLQPFRPDVHRPILHRVTHSRENSPRPLCCCEEENVIGLKGVKIGVSAGNHRRARSTCLYREWTASSNHPPALTKQCSDARWPKQLLYSTWHHTHRSIQPDQRAYVYVVVIATQSFLCSQ